MRTLCGYEQQAHEMYEGWDIPDDYTAFCDINPNCPHSRTAAGYSPPVPPARSASAPTLKEDLAIWAETTANDLRRVGISVLDNTVAFLNIQQILENIRDALESALQSVRSAIHQVETMGQPGTRSPSSAPASAGQRTAPACPGSLPPCAPTVSRCEQRPASAETALKQARDQLPTLKEDLAIWAETTANDLRRVGTAACVVRVMPVSILSVPRRGARTTA